MVSCCALYLEERRAFGRFDAALDKADYGPLWLNRPEVARKIMDSLHFMDGETIALDVFGVQVWD